MNLRRMIADNVKMNALSVLFAGNIQPEAFEKVFDNKNAFMLTLEKAASFKESKKILILAAETFNEEYILGSNIEQIKIVRHKEWNVINLIETIVQESTGFDIVYFAHADCPFLDKNITESMINRHIEYSADYSYADGFPQGLAPEILQPATFVFLAKIAACDTSSVMRDTIFSVLQKDINSFDIETEISPVDLRAYRLSLCADSKRNLLLLKRFWEEKFSSADDAEKIITTKPELLRTLPAFYPIQVVSACPQKCRICPYPAITESIENCNEYMTCGNFDALLNKIIDFSGDAVIDLSMWGEISLHPQKKDLIQAVLDKRALSLIIETSGIGWKESELIEIAAIAKNAAARKNNMSPLSIIVSLDAIEEAEYQRVRGANFNEAFNCAKKIAEIFGSNAYIQAVRFKGNEISIEKFYRYWNELKVNIIIQKYDSFCNRKEDLRAADLSPINRLPCVHNMRDFPVLLDGRVIQCREDLRSLETKNETLGNVFNEDLKNIWQRAQALYGEHCAGNYQNLCKECDEYWTFNF
ncbi:MAG: spiro-SPASM protein [Termitinemataceae bacterium]|nr:MAG: spiro-SPASM protein [Termitinemataceae bacterium]